ncbi:MAG: hypothetical protein MJ204_09465 [Bacteroidales bacterium]|nr:hypothetical protein [Bacteroidales bacterium]
MNRFHKISVMVAALAVSTFSYAQKDLLISGGNTVSSLVCSNSIVYTTGGNKTQNGTGVLGVGSSAEKEDTWKKVDFPADASGNPSINISQVNSGSGASFVALDCYGQVWGWGVNDYGQTGNGDASTKVVTKPVQVKLGTSPLKGTAYDDGHGNLANVEVVYAGNANSFAILGEGPYKGRVVAWGGNIANDNYTSSLGTGSDAQALYPTFCKDLAGNFMTDAIRIFSGDHITMILKSDGTVWTCGDSAHGTFLGRNKNGGYYTGNGGASNAFGAVYVSEGVMLSGIKEIACGDGAYLALDADGYIWSWGNDGWNSCGGTGSNGQGVGGTTPGRVLAGNTEDEDNDGTYLLAKAVGAGQAFGMAVTINGRPVAWGGGGCSGGYVGNGTEQTAKAPVYINYATGKVHDDVILINRCDSWGFYARSDGSMYAWGCNSSGQLGIGSTTNQMLATKINPPTGCGFRDPTPTATIMPGTSKVCASSFKGYTLDCGFAVAANLQPSYKITWYKDGKQVSTGNGSNTTYKTANGAAGIGKYKVVVHYAIEDGAKNNGCQEYKDAIDEIEISAYTQEFTPDGFYCGDEATIKVTPSGPTAVYSWWQTQGATTKLGESVGSEEIKIDVSDIVANADGTKTIWVQETAQASGTFMSSAQVKPTTSWDGDNALGATSSFSTGFEVKQTVVLNSATFQAKKELAAYNFQNATGEITCSVPMTITIYGAQLNNSAFIPNTVKYGTITKTITWTWENYATMNKEGNTYESIVIDGGDIVLQPGTYFLTLSMGAASSKAFQAIKATRANTKLGALKDDIDGTYLGFAGVSGYGNGNQSSTGNFYDIKFSTEQGFCDVVRYDIKQDCPCVAPEEFTIECDDAYFSETKDSVVVCANNAVATLTTTPWAASTSKAFEYIWYKDGAITKAATVGATSTALSVTSTGEYKILVRDKAVPEATACQKEVTVTVYENAVPKVTVTGGGDICEGETLATPVKLTMTGTPGFTVKYTLNGSNKTKKTKGKVSTVELDVPTAVGTYEYSLVSVNDDNNCLNDEVRGTASITIKPIPTAKITADKTEVCEGESIKLEASSDQADAEFTWGGKGSGKSASLTLTEPSATGEYKLTASLDGCESDAEPVSVTINAKPEIKTLTADKSAVCSGKTITLTATTTDREAGKFTWSGDGVTGSGKTATVTAEVTTDTEVTVTMNYSSAKGCEAEPKTIKVKFYAMPEAPTVKDQSYCVDDTPKALEATASAGATLNWYGTNATGGTASTTAPTPSTSSDTVIYYYVSQTLNGCESTERSKATVTVDANLSPVITADPASFEACAGDDIKLSVENYATIKWSGTGASGLDGVMLATPTFNSTTAGTYTVTVDVEDEKGCKGTASKTITVNAIPSATLSALTDECVSDETAQILTATVTPAGTTGEGTWRGDVTKKTETTAGYTPSEAGVGTHDITYDFVSTKGCAAQQVSTSVEVFGMPTPTISVSNASVCVSGNNSDEVTIKTTGTDAAGKFAYTINKGTVNATTGTFDPTANAAGEYTITLNYTDANGCKGTASDNVTVHALPTVTLSNPSEICYNGAPIEIQATVSPAGGKGTWTGTASSTDATFDPSTVNVGESQFSYQYTDTYKCQNSADSKIDVVSVEKPTVDAAYQPKVVIVNSGSLSDNTDLAASATTTGDKLQWKAHTPTAGSWADGASTYATGKTATSEDGSYVYLVREYKMVDGKACYSDSVTATLVLSNCEALPPSASDKYICVGSTGSAELTATRTPAASVTDYKIAWLDIDPAGKLGTAADANIIGNGTSYAPTIDMTKAGEYSYYVAEYDNAKTCWSAGKLVTIHVVDTPSVTISSPADICAKGTEVVPVTVNPKNGSLSASAGTIDGFNWLPGDYAGDSKSATFTYEVTSAAYADGTTCTSTVKSTTTAHYMEAPTGSTNIWLIGDIQGIPTGFLKGTNTSTGASMTWYDTKTKSNELGTGTSYTPDKASLQTEAGSSKTYSKTYWITQTDGNGCESEPSEVILNLVDCPWEAPTVTAIEECSGTTLDNLVAVEGASVATMAQGGTVSGWVWYDASGSEISGASSASFAHGVNNATAGVTKFSVAYKAIESSSKQECQSPKTDVTVTVLPNPTVSFEKASETVCYTTEETKIIVSATPSNGAGSGAWSITGDPSAISSNGIFYAQKNGKNEGQEQYTITYTYTDAKGCETTVDRTIDVIYLSAPETEGFYAMTTQSNPVEVNVTSALTTGASAKWFESATSTADVKGTGASWKTGDATNMVLNKEYYARQEKGGCYSDATAALVKIVPCPIPSVLISDEESCNYEAVPSLSAQTGAWAEREGSKSTFNFYKAATGGSAVGTHADMDSWVPSDITVSGGVAKAGEYTYYVSESNTEPLSGLTTNEGCESPRTAVKVTIKGTGSATVAPATSPAEVCEGEVNPSFVATNVVGTLGWYEEDPGELGEPQSAQMGDKKTFTPGETEAGTYKIWAVMYADGCYGPKVEASYTIKDIPEAPKTLGSSICFGEANTALTATGEGTISWYADAKKTSSVLKTGNSYTTNDVEVGVYTYYAAQKVKGCEGSTAAAEFEIKSLPSAPVATAQANICSYSDAPELHVYGENITWYSSDKKTVIGSGESYQTTDMTAGIKRYYASQTVDGCEGLMAPVSYTINEKPSNPEVFGASVCAGDTAIPSLRTNMLMDKWYADETCVTFLGQGYNYVPTVSEVGNSDKIYYVQRELNSCVSDVVPVTLRVIQQPTFTIGNDTILCIYDSVLTIQAGDFVPAITTTSYIDWKVSNETSYKKYMDSQDHNIQPTNMINAPGTYTVSAVYTYKYDAVTCQSEEASFTYKVIDRARTPIVFSKVICQGEDIKDLQALGSANVVWESLSGIQPAVWNGRKYKFDAGQVLDTGTYYFRLYDINLYDEENFRGCLSVADTVSMTVAPSAKTKIIGVDSVCVGETEEYYTQYTKESTYFWNVTGGHLNYAKTDATSVRYIDWSKPGIDTLTVYEQTWAGCEGFDTLVVKIAPVPEPMFTWSMPGSKNIIELVDSTFQDSLFYRNEEGILVGEEIPYTMAWNFGHQGEDESIIDMEAPYNQRNYPVREGGYIYGYNCPILTVTNSFGCKAKYTECIFVNLTSSLYVPNAFAPTNPAHSVRTFQPQGYNLNTCEISVYDKWGNLLWYSDAVEDGMFVGKWDGTYDGKMMKSDVYIWKMEATFLDGQIWEGFDNGNGKKTKFGSVTLVR